MELPVSRWGPLLLLLLLEPWTRRCSCLTVALSSSRPLSVARGQALVLEATVQLTSGETEHSLEWDMTAGQTGSKFRVHPPARSARVSVEREGQVARLRVVELKAEDYGRYTVTVTNGDGHQESASRVVQESEFAPSVAVPLLCEVSHDAERREIVWLADGVQVTQNLSADGSKLYPSGGCVRNYTCVVTSELGTRSNHFYPGCRLDAGSGGGGFTAAVVIAAVLFLALVAVVIYFQMRSRNRDGYRSPQTSGTTPPGNP